MKVAAPPGLTSTRRTGPLPTFEVMVSVALSPGTMNRNVHTRAARGQRPKKRPTVGTASTSSDGSDVVVSVLVTDGAVVVIDTVLVAPPQPAAATATAAAIAARLGMGRC